MVAVTLRPVTITLLATFLSFSSFVIKPCDGAEGNNLDISFSQQYLDFSSQDFNKNHNEASQSDFNSILGIKHVDSQAQSGDQATKSRNSKQSSKLDNHNKFEISSSGDKLFTPIHAPGKCALFSSCGKQSMFGPELPCPANIDAQEPDADARQALIEVCGAENWSEGPLCCDIGQVRIIDFIFSLLLFFLFKVKNVDVLATIIENTNLLSHLYTTFRSKL